jgi:tetratricopeptide (TPR) repeat protein
MGDKYIFNNARDITIFTQYDKDAAAVQAYDIQQAAAESRKPHEAKIEKAFAFEKAGMLELAIQEHEKIIEKDPSFFASLYSAGMLLDQVERFDESVHYLERAVECDAHPVLKYSAASNLFLALKHQGDILEERDAKLKKYDEALETYDKHLRSGRGIPSAMLFQNMINGARLVVERARACAGIDTVRDLELMERIRDDFVSAKVTYEYVLKQLSDRGIETEWTPQIRGSILEVTQYLNGIDHLIRASKAINGHDPE